MPVDPVLLRFIERITGVLIGGVAIYLGYRLFLSVPEHKDSEGKFVLPLNTSVVMSRVGPGVFFALFGIVAVCFALYRPLQMEGGRPASYAGGSTLADPDEKADARALMRREIATLNTIPGVLGAELPDHDRDSVQLSLRRVKLGLIRPVWGKADEGFGDYSAFEQWVEAGEPAPPPSGMDGALALYRYGVAP